MSPEQITPPKRERDIRLDFYRGLAMIVILFAHITDNPWNLWMPGRFGFSDATEVFVFCSGMATALAYGTVFARAGFLFGTLRVLYRIWQIYWVHIGIFMVTLFAVLALNLSGVFGRDEIGALNLYPFLRNTGPNLFGLMTLTYVPNFFDILPMYIVLLALVPVMLFLARISPALAMVASVVLWFLGTTGTIALPAEWWFSNGSTRSWFFNPFAWQLIFFTGYGLMAGWLPTPVLRRDLVILAALVVVISLPFAHYYFIGQSKALQAWRAEWRPFYDKTGFGLLRYVYFLALAYLAWAFAGPAGARLRELSRRMPRFFGMVITIGRQSLAVFASSMVLARILGALMHKAAYNWLAVLLINLAGLAMIWAVARIAGWYRRQGWKDRMQPLSQSSAGGVATATPEYGATPDMLMRLKHE